MCTNVRGPGDLDTEELNEQIRRSLNDSRPDTRWRFHIHAWSWHDAHCVYSCPFCKSFSKAEKDSYVRSRNMNPCSYHGCETCECNPYYTGYYDGKRDCRNMVASKPEPAKKVRVVIMKDHHNLDIFMKESEARGLVTNWQGGISRTITVENYDNTRKHTILTKSISSISVGNP